MRAASLVALAAVMAAAVAAYPAHHRPWMNVRATPAQRAQALVAQMTLAEKVAMLHGPASGPCCECTESPLCNYTGNVAPNARLGIPQIKMNDGPQGFRDNNNVGTTTAWPSCMTVTATWDRKAVYAWAAAMGQEFYGKGANIHLGPGLNVARVPHNGRNFEYLSGEDPFLGYEMAQPTVQGMQDQGVMACAKHYVENNQETNRMSVSANVDERTRFEIYYPPFAGTVAAGVGSYMCSYNKINGVWACENDETLNRDLKGLMGFQGFVMSDWGATHSTSIMQGLDMEMPAADFMGAALLANVTAGSIPQAAVDDAVTRILTSMFAVGMFDKPNPNIRSNNVTSPAHNDLCRQLSADSTVVLQNEGNILPLSKQAKLAVIGWAGGAQDPYVHGDGSGSVVPPRVVTPLQGITARVADSSLVTYATGAYDDATGYAAAIAAAKAADIAIVFVGTSSCEGHDRKNLSVDYDGDALIAAVAAANQNTVVVVSAPGAVLTNWAVPAIVANHMPGQEVGSAIADILFGDVTPSGKLHYTLPNSENDMEMTDLQWPGIPADDPVYANYTEQLEVGYRWYNAHNVKPRFCFGHGLSYTTFQYSALVIQGRNASVTVTNTGRVAGSEVVQAYLTYPASAGEPPRQLRAFDKFPLQPGQSAVWSFALDDRAVSIWDIKSHDWQVVGGAYLLEVGASSCDIRISGTVNV